MSAFLLGGVCHQIQETGDSISNRIGVSLERFLGEPDAPSRSLIVANRTEPEPFRQMIENLFTGQNIEVAEELVDEYDDDTVLLLEDGDVIATSPLKELSDSILMVNSDLFITGTRTLEDTAVPAVLDGLADHPFTLRGYPESNTEKLLLILISRHIERLAYESGEGTIRSSFQRLSRVRDERGTRRVYEQIAQTDVDVHLYGQPDWRPQPDFPITMHGGYKPDFKESWFVVYNPPPEKADSFDQAALLAIEKEPPKWDGFWTYDADLIEDVARYIRWNL